MIYLITEQKKAYWELICFVYLMLALLLNVVYRSPEFLRKKIENYFSEVLSYTYWKTGNLVLTIVFIWQYKTKQIKAHLRHFPRDTTLAFRIQADPAIVGSSSYFYHGQIASTAFQSVVLCHTVNEIAVEAILPKKFQIYSGAKWMMILECS